MDVSETAGKRLELALQVVEKRLGSVPLEVSAPLVAAVVQSITLDEHAERFAAVIHEARVRPKAQIPFAIEPKQICRIQAVAESDVVREAAKRAALDEREAAGASAREFGWGSIHTPAMTFRRILCDEGCDGAEAQKQCQPAGARIGHTSLWVGGRAMSPSR